jgi:outer membrane protein TolC
MRIYSYLITIGILLPSLLRAQLSPQEIIEQLYQKIPSLPAILAADSAISSALYMSKTSTYLPEPMFHFSYSPTNFRNSDINRELMFSAEQSFTWPLILSAQKQISHSDFLMSQVKKKQITQTLKFQIGSLVWNIYLFDRRITSAQQETNLLKNLEASTKILYSTGAVPQSDLLMLQAMQSDLETEMVSFQSQRKSLEIQIQGLLNDNTISIPLTSEIFELSTLPTADSLKSISEKQSSELLMSKVILKMEKAKLKLAKSMSYPEIALEIGWLSMSGYGMGVGNEKTWQVGLSASLPLWRKKYQYERQSALSSLNAAQYQAKDAYAQVFAQIEAMAGEIKGMEQAIRIMSEQTLKLAQQAFVSAQAAYASGSANFAQLIEAEVNFVNTGLKLQEMIAERGKMQARLEAMVGTEFNF